MARSSSNERLRAQAQTMTLDELDSEISRMLIGWQKGGTSQGRRAHFKGLLALEAVKEVRFGVPAKKRRYNR